jgi:hypothetical protein
MLSMLLRPPSNNTSAYMPARFKASANCVGCTSDARPGSPRGKGDEWGEGLGWVYERGVMPVVAEARFDSRSPAHAHTHIDSRASTCPSTTSRVARLQARERRTESRSAGRPARGGDRRVKEEVAEAAEEEEGVGARGRATTRLSARERNRVAGRARKSIRKSGQRRRERVQERISFRERVGGRLVEAGGGWWRWGREGEQDRACVML